MKITKDEHELIKLRENVFKKMDIWHPTTKEIEDMVKEMWRDVLSDKKKEYLYYMIDLVIQPTFKQKYNRTENEKVFGRFVGQPNGDAVIFLYWLDVCEINLYQKKLIKDHIYYVLEHELKHYFGHSHEDMESIEDFSYPGNQKGSE